MEKLEKNIKYYGKFSIQTDSLKDIYFDAQMFFNEENNFQMEVSYSSPVIETIDLTNFIEHTFNFYDIQGFIIIGKKKNEISLLNCSLSKNSWYESFDRKSSLKTLYNRYVKINIGAYILNTRVTSNSPIQNAKFKFSALSMWADKLEYEDIDNILRIPKTKEWHSFVDTGDELIIKNFMEEEKCNNQVSLKQTAALYIIFKEMQSFRSYLDYGRIYNDFFVLMTGRKSDIENFYVIFEGQTDFLEVFVNYKSCNPVFTEKVFFTFDYLIKNLFSLNKWYTYYKKTNLAYSLFFDTFHFKERYMTDILLDAYIRSFEGMITKFYFINNYFITGSKNQKIIKSIKKNIIPLIESSLKKFDNEKFKIDNYLERYKQTVLDSFSHAYELSFKNRIELFFDLHKNHFIDEFNKYDRNEIIAQMIQFRNAYAHTDDSKLNIESLFTLIRFIKKMILVHLYSDVLELDNYTIDFKDLI